LPPHLRLFPLSLTLNIKIQVSVKEELPADMVIVAIDYKQDGPKNKRIHWAMNEVQVTGKFFYVCIYFFYF
jgi:hypothetical protein